MLLLLLVVVVLASESVSRAERDEIVGLRLTPAHPFHIIPPLFAAYPISCQQPYEKEPMSGATAGVGAARKRRRLTSAGGRVAAKRAAQGIVVSPDTARLWEALAPLPPPLAGESAKSSAKANTRKRKRGEGMQAVGAARTSVPAKSAQPSALFRGYPHLKLALPTTAPDVAARVVESYAQPVNDAEDPANEIEDAYNPKHNGACICSPVYPLSLYFYLYPSFKPFGKRHPAVFRWRSLRLFALSRVSFLAEATFATEALVTASRKLEEERESRRKIKK